MLIKLFILLSILSTTFAQTEAPDPCAAELKKFCAPGVINEGRWSCLGKNFSSLSKPCSNKIQQESLKAHHACYLSAISLCKAEFGDTIRKHYLCLATNSDKLPKMCLAMIVGMRSKGQEFRNKIRDTCAGDYQKHCPGMKEAQETKCLEKAWKGGIVSKPCAKILDTASKSRK